MTTLLSRRSFAVGALASAGLAGGLVWRSAASARLEDPTSGRALIFEDNFTRLDWSTWSAGPKPTTSDPGFYGRSAFARDRGEEGFNPYAIVDDPNASDGKALEVAAKHIGQPMKVPNYYGNDLAEFQWISGNIQTAKRDGTVLKGWRRGYFEARMLFPRHPLSWPAFWMMNGRSILRPQTSIEIDVVEHKGWEPTLYGAYLHEWGQPGEHNEGTGVPTPIDMTAGYCRYGVLVTDTECTIYFERQPIVDTKTGMPAVWTINRSAQLDADQDVFWPVLTLALRSDVPYPQPLLPADTLTRMRVDYFRVYA
ncbi:Glycoside hydrolase, family 16 (plasmid) [Neorhizobium galegae bv. officinalis bv. officinalis str. HAMBI 1141]|uniref:Glycoside hydrolase, family 16 n=1 Tax=Neorhizobium galegae bv. officinalis bv. officinalis str. HAMBI 1141 TaxID=1028801 RepID=A0A068TJ04_NEOGA|nr:MULTISPECIES: family 16 glycosylhydrolase [Neorhizobium]MCJ9668415.1 family 16 glycosylhydrolase [Neorhizobium sp. SHOUNA12B]MCJ9744054.1 family 16 glycosylhydrolase [Neorhizobium sp. SHOUNA12A]CDN58099.1 Glycoside hydrolase, family 16 [Neorhizobium galegae bv. officinalis bv. officinalis str. HAMBI 1141]